MRYNWAFAELEAFYEMPLLELIGQARSIHKEFHPRGTVQKCHLISIKTGGCPEDCKYCAQSSRYQTSIKAEPLMSYKTAIEKAKKAISNGATRICLGAAWRGVRDNRQFKEVLQIVRGITDLNVEVCCTLGFLTDSQAARLKEAGLYAYNHNLDSSKKYYKTIITTRTYEDRLKTLDTAEKAGLSICCGGIIGMGESIEDRLQLLLTLCQRNPHPDSVPINLLSPVPGTPLEKQPPVSIWEMVRMIAITRTVMPKAMVRLSAGRIEMSIEHQVLCFLAGVNSIFIGEKLLTVGNTPIDADEKMFEILGLK